MKLLSALVLSVFASLLTISAAAPAIAEAESTGEVMFVLDASSSMLAKDGTATTRIDKAKSALKQTVAGLPADTKIGLRVYGSQESDADSNKSAGCKDSRLVSGPKVNNAAAISSSIDDIQAKGWTLMGKTLQDVQGDFTGSGPKTVILLSDGIDTCAPPSACDVAKNVTAGGAKIKVNTLGILVSKEARTQLTCIAQNGGGDYFDVSDLNRLQSTLASLTAREVALFTAQGIPVKGTLRTDDAPTLLSNTSYTDTITVPQELYYGFDALPEQQITITVKAVGRDTGLRNVDFLQVGGLTKDTSENLTSVKYRSARFGVSDPTTAVYKVDTAKAKISKPTQLAFRIAIDPNSTSNVDGVNVPLEIRITTEGGLAPDNTSSETEATSSTDKDGDGPATIVVVLLTLLGVAVMAAGAYGVRRYMRSRNAKNKSIDPITQPRTTVLPEDAAGENPDSNKQP